MSETVTLALIPCYLFHSLPPTKTPSGHVRIVLKHATHIDFSSPPLCYIALFPQKLYPFLFCEDELSTTALIHLFSVRGSYSPGLLLEWTESFLYYSNG